MTALPLLQLIAGRDTTGWLETRSEHEHYRKHTWLIPTELDACGQWISKHGQQHTVYVACAPRNQPGGGGRDAVDHANCLWVDCDGLDAADRLRAFTPAATMLVSSGYGLHGWWALDRPVSADMAHRANARLAHHLGADPRCAEPARILRPPGTLNFKGDEPRPVEVVAFTGETHTLTSLVAHLPDPEAARRSPSRTPPDRATNDGMLDGISPLVYVPRLSGRVVDRRGFVQCPWHGGGDERTPSLKVYGDASKGWHCFAGCGGGDIYAFAARMWGLATSSRDFVEVKRRLAEVFG